MVGDSRFDWYFLDIGRDGGFVEEDVSCSFSRSGEDGELTLWVDSIDETSTRAPRPMGEKSQIEEILRYIPIVGLM